MFAGLREGRPWAIALLIALGAGAVLFWWVVLSAASPLLESRSFYQAAGSMEPTLAQGDRFFVLKTAYRTASPRRGDLIAFYDPKRQNVIYVKRIVGLPGDRVQMKAGFLYVNGTPAKLQKLGVTKGDCTDSGCTTLQQYREYPPGSGAYNIQLRIGGVAVSENTDVYVVPADSYFVLGDNRDNSLDSRYQDFGFVPRSAIVGRVTTRYYNARRQSMVWERVE